MTQSTESKSIPLSDAYKDLLQIVKGAANKELKQKTYSIQAEVNYINYKVYGGNQYIKAFGDDESLIQLIVPADIARTLQTKHYYEFSGSFEVSNSPDFGFFQFRVTHAVLTGTDMRLEAKKQAAGEMIEKGYLDKYKDDFGKFRGKSECLVALVTSHQSQVIRDVMEVFKTHRGIKYEIIPVKLNDAESIADGIAKASGGQYDVTMVVRGGGNDNDFAVFNDLGVVKAIYDSTIPVVVGIGHTDNNTFADKAADRSETTPSKAARFLVDALGQPAIQPVQAQQHYKQSARRDYENKSERRSRDFKKSESGYFAIRLGLVALLLAVGALAFFVLIPKVFERILNGM